MRSKIPSVGLFVKNNQGERLRTLLRLCSEPAHRERDVFSKRFLSADLDARVSRTDAGSVKMS